MCPGFSRSHALRGNAYRNAPALRHAGASLAAFPRRAWERDRVAADLAYAAGISDERLCIAEAFVRFAQEQRLEFWRAE